MKRPSFQFYPGDWINDAALRLVSVGARGAWIDMLCLMHQGTPYGHLKVNHKVILPANLARILGATLPETEGWLGELREAGVFDEADDGGIFSRRMVRDEKLRQVRAAGGKKGGNPALTGAKKDKPKVDDKVNLQPNLKPTPSSSSSSSSSSSNQEQPAPSKKHSAASSPVALDTWVQSLAGGEAIKADDPIFDYADKANLPFDFIELAWKRFCEDMRARGIRKKDWRAHFRNAVKGNWHRLWYADGDGWKLTTAGEQARRTLA